MPFVALLSDPAAVSRSLASSPIGRFVPDGIEMWPVHIVGGAVIALFLLTNLLGFFSVWLSVRFSARLGVKLTRDLATCYLRQGFIALRERGPSVSANDVTKETEKVVSGGILQLCMLISKFIQVLLIVGLLALVSPVFMAAFGGISAVLYIGLYGVLRKRTAAAGRNAMNASAESSQKANELFLAAKDILVLGRGDYFSDRVAQACERYYRADAFARMVPSIPKYAIEVTAFGAILSIPVYRSLMGEEYRSLLPVIALFAYAGYRILPALQQTYSSFTIIKFFEALAVRMSSVFCDSALSESSKGEAASGCAFKSEIELKEVGYTYPNALGSVLKGFNLKLRLGDKLAVIGPSGAGKSTFLDLLLGLISVEGGDLLVDGHSVGSKFAWGRTIGYVPQAPVIIRASVAENIGFGLEISEIDIERCREVARIAGVDQVLEALPDGYSTFLGDTVSLSGGESQRLAIARALYHAPPLIIMDEPSSALDPAISEQVVRRLCSSELDVTLVVVTHDWELLNHFQRVVLIDAGRVCRDGAPHDLADDFARLRETLNNN